MTTPLPIVARELRVAARRGKTYWLRLAAALGAFVICIWLGLWAATAQPPAVLGKSLFAALTVLAFGYCLLVGPFITADCVAEEKRDGTLGLLFLTDLSSLDVLLGKWIATSLAGFYGLLAILPAMGLPLLLGGVTPAESGRTALAIVNAILFSLTAGVLVSTLSRDQSKAPLAAAMVILGISGLIPGLWTVAASGFFTKPMAQFPPVALASPAYTGYLALDAVYRASPKLYWTSLAVVHGLCWAFLIAAAVLLPRVWREHPADKPVAPRWLWRFGYTRGWRRLFKRRLERNPVFAVAARLRWPYIVFWCLVGLVAINVSWFIFGYRGNVGGAQFHVYFSRAVVFLNRVWIATMACRFILEARRSGALELMLTSPLPVRTLMRGHWRALRHLFFWQVFFIALLHVFYVVGSLKPAAPGMMVPPNALQSYALAAAGSMVSFLADVFGLCWLGAWISLASRKPNLAVLKTFTLVILIPEAIAYFLPAYRVAFGGGLISYYVARPACWILKNSLFVAFAAYKLRRHFRAAAAGAYAWNWWRPHWPWRAERTRRPALKGPGFERAVAPPTLRDGGGCR